MYVCNTQSADGITSRVVGDLADGTMEQQSMKQTGYNFVDLPSFDSLRRGVGGLGLFVNAHEVGVT